MPAKISTVCTILFWLATSFADGQLQSDLVGYWQFNVNGNDSAPTNRPLDVVGAPDYEPGMFGCALSLTGNANQFAIRPQNDADFDLGNTDFTIQIWVNFASTGGEQTLIEKFTGGAGPGYTLTKLNTNRLQFFASGLAVIDSPVLPIENGAWNHVLVRRIGQQLAIFLNGQAVVESIQTGSIAPSPNPLLIGERHNSQQFPVHGLIDEVAFWKRGITNAEVTQLFNEGNGLLIIPNAEHLPGDINLDGSVNLLDVGPFVVRVSSGEYQIEADMNNDCVINLLDIAGFIAAVGGG